MMPSFLSRSHDQEAAIDRIDVGRWLNQESRENTKIQACTITPTHAQPFHIRLVVSGQKKKQ